MKTRPILAGALSAAMLMGVAACASSGTTTGMRRDSDVLTPEEIAEASVSNLYEAVERFRPRWLLIRSQRSLNLPTEIAVFLNASYLGDPQALRQVDMVGLIQLRYMDGPRASALYRVPDGRAIEGAIIVEVGR